MGARDRGGPDGEHGVHVGGRRLGAPGQGVLRVRVGNFADEAAAWADRGLHRLSAGIGVEGVVHGHERLTGTGRDAPDDLEGGRVGRIAGVGVEPARLDDDPERHGLLRFVGGGVVRRRLRRGVDDRVGAGFLRDSAGEGLGRPAVARDGGRNLAEGRAARRQHARRGTEGPRRG